MEMRLSPFRQFLVAGIFALSLLAGIGTAGHVAAAPIDKAAFKAGCESGGGSYIENADGSFQCNTTSGITIKCPNTTDQCYILPRRWLFNDSVIVELPQGGVMQAIAEGNTSTPDGHAGTAGSAADTAMTQPDEGHQQDQGVTKHGKQGKNGGKHRRHHR